MSEEKSVFVEPSASGPTQKLENHPDGTVHVNPGKAHEGREGTMRNPGVRQVSVAHQGPRCPSCGQTSLKMHMNKPVGQRVYCSNPGCNYDQAHNKIHPEGGVDQNPDIKIVEDRGMRQPGGGVKILKQQRIG